MRSIFSTCYLIFREVIAQTIIYLLLPFALFDWDFKKGNKTPILLIHGYIHFGAVWLFQIYWLKKKGYGPIYTVNLGNPFRSIEEYSKVIQQKVAKIEQQTQKKELIMVGHSMGGLIAAYAALELPLSMKISKIITIGSPLHGTRVANLGFGECTKEMRRDASFIEALLKKIEKNYEIKFYHIASKSDEIVKPYDSALMGKEPGREYLIDGAGHLTILFRKEISEKITEWLEG